jgi:hypothetical protein
MFCAVAINVLRAMLANGCLCILSFLSDPSLSKQRYGNLTPKKASHNTIISLHAAFLDSSLIYYDKPYTEKSQSQYNNLASRRFPRQLFDLLS